MAMSAKPPSTIPMMMPVLNTKPGPDVVVTVVPAVVVSELNVVPVPAVIALAVVRSVADGVEALIVTGLGVVAVAVTLGISVVTTSIHPCIYWQNVNIMQTTTQMTMLNGAPNRRTLC